jgi:Flp pilus assembly protein TadB
MPADGELVITDPEQARQFAIGQRALRRSMVMSIALDVLLALVLVAMGVSLVVVLILGVLIIGASTYALTRIQRQADARLVKFRDPVTGRVEIPDR